ncbi:hypothetical protein IOMTU157_4434 [Citrobacter portucalensis]|nr:hypothetical protein IOMTU157_4434 [Citrobacter portucalensis]
MPDGDAKASYPAYKSDPTLSSPGGKYKKPPPKDFALQDCDSSQVMPAARKTKGTSGELCDE